MIIVWTGWGFVIAPLLVGWVAIVAAVGEASRPRYLAAILLAGALAAALTYAMSVWLARKPERELIDAKTGQRVVLQRRDSFFFVPLRY